MNAFSWIVIALLVTFVFSALAGLASIALVSIIALNVCLALSVIREIIVIIYPELNA